MLFGQGVTDTRATDLGAAAPGWLNSGRFTVGEPARRVAPGAAGPARTARPGVGGLDGGLVAGRFGCRRHDAAERIERRLANRRPNVACGMTLIELLTVVAIVAILASLAAPSFASLRRAVGVSTATSELLGALHFARSAAILNGLPATLCLSADDLTCVSTAAAAAKGWLVFLEPDATVAASSRVVPPVLRRFQANGDVVVHGSRAAVTFWPTTRASTTSTFDVCDAKRGAPGRAVVVSQLGRPRVALEEASCAP